MDDSRTLIEGGAEDVVGWARIADVVERERIGRIRGRWRSSLGRVQRSAFRPRNLSIRWNVSPEGGVSDDIASQLADEKKRKNSVVA
jgi:hypothetical protein